MSESSIKLPEDCAEIDYGEDGELDGAGHARLTTYDTLAIGGMLVGAGVLGACLYKFGPAVLASCRGGGAVNNRSIGAVEVAQQAGSIGGAIENQPQVQQQPRQSSLHLSEREAQIFGGPQDIVPNQNYDNFFNM